MDAQRLLAYFQPRQDEMLGIIEQLVSQETPSSDKGRLDAFASFLSQRLQAAGATVEILPNADRGNHVRARFGPNTGVKPALILCHYDTVWAVGSLATHPYRIEDGKAYGPGIFDMQSSLMLCEEVARASRDLSLELPRPVTILITSDEEVGSPTSRNLIEEEARRSAYVLVMESPLPGGVLKTSRKGVGVFTLEITGRAAHAGVEPSEASAPFKNWPYQILAAARAD